MASEPDFMSPRISSLVKRQNASAGAGAPASAAPSAERIIRDYAIPNPLADNLIEVSMDTLSLPKEITNGITEGNSYSFYRDQYTAPNWIYVGFGKSRDIIVAVFNTNNNKVYHIIDGLISTTAGNSFGFKNTRLKHGGGSRRRRQRRQRRRQTRRS